jgi:oxygen-independent coproporphyrinogen-3 oxidase
VTRNTADGVISAPRWFSDADHLRYQAYSYSYPHKTAYREFAEPIALDQLWKSEKQDALFLYLHIPFCEMRCGFCNLFTTTNAGSSVEREYLDALERQCQTVRQALSGSKFARLALGGGTPTYLTAAELERLFDMVRNVFAASPADVPCSVETSPYTTDPDKLRVLKDRGVERLSIGVQSFVEPEVMAVGRTQNLNVVDRALGLLKGFDFDVLNIDLMYGLPGQTSETWLYSLKKTVSYEPEQIYLYPLYIRPLTGLGRKRLSEFDSERSDDIRVLLYRQAHEFLTEAGYVQVSMRMFERAQSPVDALRPTYCCQDDGMVGVGCGARSYTSTHHYSTKYAVGSKPVREILQDYIAQPGRAFSSADFGFVLNDDEQKRRFLIQSLLQLEGLVLADYERRFATAAGDDFGKELAHLFELGLAQVDRERITLTNLGLEWSDRIGFELYSANVTALMSDYEGA